MGTTVNANPTKEFFISMLTRDVQYEKVPLFIVVMPFGILIFTRAEHFANALDPILVTASGIIILSRLVQPLNT